MHQHPLLYATLIAPLAIIPAMLMIVTLQLFVQIPKDIAAIYGGAFMIAIVGLTYSYGFTLLYGLPVYLILRRYGRHTFTHLLTASLIPALILFALLQAWPFFVAMVWFSGITGIAFWYLAERLGRQS